MRTPYPIAFIGPEHYRVFQDILGAALPASYDEWLSRHSIEKLERARGGREVQEIEISPDELIRYGNAHATTATRTPRLPTPSCFVSWRWRRRAKEAPERRGRGSTGPLRCLRASAGKPGWRLGS